MKVKKSELKTARTGYLYSDGHLVLLHEKNDRDAGRVEWATIHENVGINCRYPKGRLIIDQGALPFVLAATSIEAKAAAYDQGSDNTKSRGIRVETIILYNGIGHRGFIISSMPDLISNDLKYQPETSEDFDEVKDTSTWGMTTIKTVHKEAE